MGINSISGIGSETLIEIQTGNFSIIWNVFSASSNSSCPPPPSSQIFSYVWQDELGQCDKWVCKQALQSPSLREVSLSHKFSYIASFSGADCFWMPLHAVCRLRVIRPRYGVLDKFPDVSSIAKESLLLWVLQWGLSLFFCLFSHLRHCVFATTICNSVLHKRFNCISGTAKTGVMFVFWCTLPTIKLPGIQEYYYSCARRNLMRWTAWSLQSSISLHTQQRMADETNLHALVPPSHFYSTWLQRLPSALSWLILMILTMIQQAD